MWVPVAAGLALHPLCQDALIFPFPFNKPAACVINPLLRNRDDSFFILNVCDEEKQNK
jgi:hypothetical protein